MRAHGGEKQHQIARKKMENQPEPNAGSSYCGWRDAFEGHACRYPHYSEATLE
jgi:hypothetical protein